MVKYFSPNDKKHPTKQSSLLFEINKYLETTGMANPLHKIYIISEQLPHIALVLFLYVLEQTQRLQYDQSIGKKF